MKFHSSDMNIDVYGSDQNGANPLLKVTGASNDICVECIEKWLKKWICSKMLIHPVMKQVKYFWLSHWIIQSNHFFIILKLQIHVLNILYFKYIYMYVCMYVLNC